MANATWLSPHALLSTPLRGRVIDVTCASGSVWITREGAHEDVVLDAGQSFHAVGSGRLVVEALEPSQVELDDHEDDVPREPGPSRALVVAALLAVYVIWGSTYFAMRVALVDLPPFLMSGPRFLLAGAAMYAFLRLRGAKAPTREQWIACAKVGALLLVGGNGAVAFAEKWNVASGVAAVVVASMPIWAAVFARAFGMRTTGSEWIGLTLGFGGVVLLNLGGAVHLDAAGLVLLLAPILWALGSVWSKRLPLPEGPMATAAQMIAGGVMMIALSFASGERVAHFPGTRALLAMAYLSVFGSIVAFTAYNWLLRNVRPSLATSYAYVNPMVALGIGAALGGEKVASLTLAAAAVSLMGVAVISRASRSSPS